MGGFCVHVAIDSEILIMQAWRLSAPFFFFKSTDYVCIFFIIGHGHIIFWEGSGNVLEVQIMFKKIINCRMNEFEWTNGIRTGE